MNGKRIAQHLIESDIYKATSSRDCPVTGKECHIPDKKGAESDRVWAEYIQQCAETHSSDIFSTADWQGRFVDCCNKCDVYKEYKHQQKTRSLIQKLQTIQDTIKKQNKVK